MGIVTDDGTTCTQEAKEGYKFVKDCSKTVPEICTTEGYDVSEAETCITENKDFLKCANNKKNDVCECFDDYPPLFSPECEAIVNIQPAITNQI